MGLIMNPKIETMVLSLIVSLFVAVCFYLYAQKSSTFNCNKVCKMTEIKGFDCVCRE